MIRSTTNETIASATKEAANPAANDGISGESIELVDTNAGIAEKKDSEARVAGQTTTPASAFNGTYE